MVPRSKARRWAFQMIYQVFAQPSFGDLSPIFSHFWAHLGEPLDDEAQEFCEDLVAGVQRERVEIDAALERHAKNWRLERMAAVDLSALRLGVYELRYTDLPVNIVINEALDLVKQFSSAESAAFVNGILDAIAKDITLKKA